MSKPQISEGRPPGIDRSVDDGRDRLSIGNVCHVLQNRRRRLVLEHLREVDGSIRTSDLVEAVAARENDTTPERLDHSERQRVYIALHQVHLPTLDDAGAVSYDGDRGTIDPQPTADGLYTALEELERVSTSTVSSESAARKRETVSPLKERLFLISITVALVGFLLGLSIGTETANLVFGSAFSVTWR